jgi:SSS family solute:Na+ symporter
VEFGMWVLSIVVVSYVASGGLKTVAYVDILQAILLALGIVVIGAFTLYFVGGWERLLEGIAVLTHDDSSRTPAGYSHYIAIPGVIQFVSDGSKAQGGEWTSLMILTYLFGLMGIMSSPAFSMWAFASEKPDPFAPQQVWASSLVIGFILIFFTAIQGIGGHFLGANRIFMAAHPGLVNPVMSAGLHGADLLAVIGRQDLLVPQLINVVENIAPWLVGLLAVCALAAMESTASCYMATAGGLLTRDVFRRFLIPGADDRTQKFIGRLCTVLVVVLALGVASTATDSLVVLGGMAVSYGFQMWPALIAACYWPFLTRQGITLGLIAGLIAVTLTEPIGQQWFGITAWGRWPLTIHSAGWGMLFNFSIAILVSLVTRDDKERKLEFHGFLREYTALPKAKRHLIPLAWILTLLWFFFAIGPGAVIGNTLFGNPNNPRSWLFGMPSIWIWQFLGWALGVGLMWFLAYYMEMSRLSAKKILSLDKAAENPVV